MAKPQPTTTEVIGEVVLERYVDPNFVNIPITGGAVGRLGHQPLLLRAARPALG